MLQLEQQVTLRRGLTLVETIIASFLLVGGFLVTVALFHSTLRYSTQIERVTVATALAERRLNEMRLWARTLSNFRSSWAAYDGVTTTDPQSPDLRILSEVSQPSGGPPNPRLASPCASLDGLQALAQQKPLTASCRRVRVTVSWPPYTSGNQVRLVALIEEPRLNWKAAGPIVVTLSGTGPLGHNGTTTATAQGYDQSGAAIPDLVYHYYVQPDNPPSMASISQNRMGTSATLTHAITLFNGSTVYGPTGRVIVTVRAVYRGQERWGSSAPVSLL